MHRFYLSESIPASGSFLVTDPRVFHQCSRVLRLSPGEKIVLFSGDGRETVVSILLYETSGVSVQVISVEQPKRESDSSVSLYCAILKQDHFDLVVQKATEVGVSRIIPVISKRTVKRSVNLERLQRIALEASEQSGRLKLPVLSDPLSFKDALEASGSSKEVLFCALGGDFNPLDRSEQRFSSIFIGPEGGWDPSEEDLARSAGVLFASLGNLTFRAETAAIIASYLAVFSA